MPRIVDLQRFTARQTAILAAAYRCFATEGYETTSTADICRAADISSGTLFHYFPTKLDILVTLLRVSAAWTEEQLHLATRAGAGRPALTTYLGALDRQRAAEQTVGFARAVQGMAHLHTVAAVLDVERDMVDRFLLDHITEAVRTSAACSDATPEQLVRWVRWLVDGSALHETPASSTTGVSVAVRSLLLLG
ncbi:TetR/AcrR family transcriptional regulator [Plantibacter sp. 2H11-2]|uniref:TetR/AcrR family transcriptional regulator n=1 Tax=Plantibacter sp. 2H11-2 TaxID=3414431 RepID=UPI003CE93DF1